MVDETRRLEEDDDELDEEKLLELAASPRQQPAGSTVANHCNSDTWRSGPSLPTRFYV